MVDYRLQAGNHCPCHLGLVRKVFPSTLLEHKLGVGRLAVEAVPEADAPAGRLRGGWRERAGRDDDGWWEEMLEKFFSR